MSAEKLANELKNILIKRIQADQLVVPTIPSVVQKVQEALREGDQSASKRAAEILEQDAFLAARAQPRSTHGGGRFDRSVARALVARSGCSEAGDKPPRYGNLAQPALDARPARVPPGCCRST